MGPLTLLALLGLSLGVGRYCRFPPAQAFFFAAAFAILSLYVGALVGALWWTALAVHVAGVAFLGFEALRRARQPKGVAVPVPIGVLAILCAWFLLVHGADRYFLYDEYAHWGVFLKEMLAHDGLWTGATVAMHPRYPPGAPLWQYLFNAFVAPSEGKAYFAHFVLLLAPLLLLWNAIRWSQPVWVIAILALVLLAIANFGLGSSTLYVDQLVGAWYLGALLAALADDDLDVRRLALYAAPLAVIALLKDVGLALAASGALIIAALSCRRMLASGQSRSAVPRRTAVGLAVLLVPMLLCVQLWSWNRDAVGAAHDVQSVDGFLSGVADRAHADASSDAELARRLAEVFFDQQLSNSPATWTFNEFTYEMRESLTEPHRLTTFGLLVAFASWWIVIAVGVLAREERHRWLIVAGGVLATALVYIAALHSSYRFTFGDRGLDLPSYLRYVHIVALPMLLLSFCPLLPGFQPAGPQRAWRVGAWAVPRAAALFAAAGTAAYALETPYLRPILQPNPQIERRAKVEPLLDAIRASLGTSRLWIYFGRDPESDFFIRMVQYLLVPTPTAVEDSPQFLQAEDAAGIAATWRSFDYVWIAELPSVEAGIGLARFTGGTARPGLYRVRSSSGVEIALEPLAEQEHRPEPAALDHASR